MMIGVALAAVVFGPMVFEAVLAGRHEGALRARGAVEPPDDVYGLMRFAYPICFLAMVAEGTVRGNVLDSALAAGGAVFGLAKTLKYWAIVTLGQRWTFRVLVPLRSTPILAGPYRVLRHPNYLAVVGELVGVALMAHAWITGPAAIVGFCVLIRARIRVEERALGQVAE